MQGGFNMSESTYRCAIERRCGGCQWLDVPYHDQLARKQQTIKELFTPYLKRGAMLDPIIGMDTPAGYRNKVIAPFAPGPAPKRKVSSKGHRRPRTSLRYGMYAEHSHRIIPVEKCLVEAGEARDIIATVAEMAASYGIEAYDEDNGTGLLRHVMVRTSRFTGESIVTLVLTSRDIPSRKSFARELVERQPSVSTVVININDRDTNAVLGDREVVIYGRGFITDVLCGCRFRISSQSFYQTNPIQTEKLYGRAMELAGLDGGQRVLDAYCGIGTIGLVASRQAAEVVGVERNASAVRDARANARLNEINNVRFAVGDSSEWALEAARQGEHFDVAFLDPPRSGSSEQFLRSLAELGPRRVVYISCGPATQRRDVDLLSDLGYRLERIAPVDMFPHTPHIENICQLERV